MKPLLKTFPTKKQIFHIFTPLILRRVSGHSMEPTLQQGWVLICLRSRRIAFGDVVIAQVKGTEVVKRVVEVKRKRAHLAGDHHGHDGSHDSGWVAYERIIARVIWPRV